MVGLRSARPTHPCKGLTYVRMARILAVRYMMNSFAAELFLGCLVFGPRLCFVYLRVDTLAKSMKTVETSCGTSSERLPNLAPGSRFWAQDAKKGLRSHRARPHLNVVRQRNHASLRRPEFAEAEEHVLERERSSVDSKRFLLSRHRFCFGAVSYQLSANARSRPNYCTNDTFMHARELDTETQIALKDRSS